MVLNYSPRSVHCNVLVCSDYNIYQYMHMTDKWWRLSDFGSALTWVTAQCVYTPAQNSCLMLYFFVLYESRVVCVLYFCVLWNCLSLKFSSPLYWNWKQNGSCLVPEYSLVESILKPFRRTWYLLACPLGFLTRVLPQIVFLELFILPVFKSKCCCGSLRVNWEQNGYHLMRESL